MARARRSNAAPASDDAQTTLVTDTATKTRTRRSADEEIALCEAKLASARDRKLLEDVKKQGADKRLLAAFSAMTRLRPWLSTEIYDQIRSELGTALAQGLTPVEVALADDDDNDNEGT